MSTQNVVNRLYEIFPENIKIESSTGDTIQFYTKKENLLNVVSTILNHLSARFLTSVGIDKRELAGCFEVNHLFALDGEKVFLIIRVEIDPSQTEIPSITPLIAGANWAEREIRDLIGVSPVNHPDPRRLVLPDDWPDDIFPLRRDFPYSERPERIEGKKPAINPPPDGSTILPIGPFFPTLEEPTFINLYVHGEEIVGMDYRGFYTHRGIEKMADSELTYQQVPFIAERICGICGFVHSSTYCQAVEKAIGLEIPERARYIRTILLEMERIHSHLLWLGLACHFIGFDTLFMQAWRIREPVMWLAEYLTGNRKTYGINKIGGVTRDLPEDAKSRILPVIEKIETETENVVNAIIEDGSLHARLKGSGFLTRTDALSLCVVGPTARGSGIDIDVRRDHPFAAYADLKFDVCVEEGCDNWARTMVRIRELKESINLLRQALAKMPGGAFSVDFDEVKPNCVGVSSVEAPRGEVHHFVLTSTNKRPFRWRVRAPSYNNLQSIPYILKGMTIADAPISVGSLDPCFSCTDRISVIEKDSGHIKIYKKEELLLMSKKRSVLTS